MERIVVIQDVKTKEYFFSYRIDQGWTANISDADTFENESMALAKATEEYLEDTFAGRYIELKEYYKFEE